MDRPCTARGPNACDCDLAVKLGRAGSGCARTCLVIVGTVVETGVPVPVGVLDALGLAVAVAEAVALDVADALPETPTVAIDTAWVSVAVGAAWPDAAGGGRKPPSNPITSKTGTAIRVIQGRMYFSTELVP